MKKTLISNLILTFFISLFLTGIFFAIWIAFTHKGSYKSTHLDNEIILLCLVGNLFLNFCYAIITFFSYLFSSRVIFENSKIRPYLYFAVPAVIAFFILISSLDMTDKILYFLSIISFSIIHAFFYYSLFYKEVNTD